MFFILAFFYISIMLNRSIHTFILHYQNNPGSFFSKNPFFYLSGSTCILGIILLLFVNIGCNKHNVALQNVDLDVQFLGHKGGGNSSFNPLYIENTLSSIKYGLETLDGIEVDVQMSLDGTLWMYHNPNLMSTCCIPNYSHAIIALNDSVIQKLSICNGTISDRVYKLEEMLNYWRSQPVRFPFSIHLKLDQTTDTFNIPGIGGKAAYLSKFADSLAKLLPSISPTDTVMVEAYDAAFLKKIKTLIPALKVCCDREGNFTVLVDTAIKGGYHGISASFNADGISFSEVKRARENGLIVQLWTPDTQQEIIATYLLKPTFIQSDNIYAALICLPYYNSSGN